MWTKKKTKQKKESQKLSKWRVVKLVGSWKLENGVNKGDVREKKRGDSKKKSWNINVELWSF